MAHLSVLSCDRCALLGVTTTSVTDAVAELTLTVPPFDPATVALCPACEALVLTEARKVLADLAAPTIGLTRALVAPQEDDAPHYTADDQEAPQEPAEALGQAPEEAAEEPAEAELWETPCHLCGYDNHLTSTRPKQALAMHARRSHDLTLDELLTGPAPRRTRRRGK